MDKATHKGVLTANAPNPMPHIFPQAVVTTNGFVFCSGSIAMDPKTLKVIDGDIQAHTVSQVRFSSISFSIDEEVSLPTLHKGHFQGASYYHLEGIGSSLQTITY
jgi:hypothetical protein